MTPLQNATSLVPSASEYILDNFAPRDRIAMLVLNRDFGETIQRLTSAQKGASPEFQAFSECAADGQREAHATFRELPLTTKGIGTLTPGQVCRLRDLNMLEVANLDCPIFEFE